MARHVHGLVGFLPFIVENECHRWQRGDPFHHRTISQCESLDLTHGEPQEHEKLRKNAGLGLCVAKNKKCHGSVQTFST